MKDAVGSLDLKACSVKKLDEKLKNKWAMLISSTSQGDYLLFHQREDEIDSWVKLIIEKGTPLLLLFCFWDANQLVFRRSLPAQCNQSAGPTLSVWRTLFRDLPPTAPAERGQ